VNRVFVRNVFWWFALGFALILGCAHAGNVGRIGPADIEIGSRGGALTVRITGTLPGRGTIRVALFDRMKGFATESGMLVGRKAPAGDRDPVEVRFDEPVQGRYAISTFQDLNDNGVLDTGAFGIPTEPYGFSRNATGAFGPPTFDDAAFNHGAADQTILIHLGGVTLPSR